MREAEEEADKNRPSWIPKGGLARWAQNKAAETWASFGKAQGGWKVRALSGYTKVLTADGTCRGVRTILEKGWRIGWNSKSWH
jgi:hypothetical protein